MHVDIFGGLLCMEKACFLFYPKMSVTNLILWIYIVLYYTVLEQVANVSRVLNSIEVVSFCIHQ